MTLNPFFSLSFQDHFTQACCEREQVQVSRFVFPDGVEGIAAGASAAVEGDGDKKRKDGVKREEGESDIGSHIGSTIR